MENNVSFKEVYDPIFKQRFILYWNCDFETFYKEVTGGSATYCYVEFRDFAAEYHPDLFSELKQARLRPYTAEEMRALMGKVLERKDGDAFLITAYTPQLEKDLCAVDIDNMWVTPDDVLKDYTIDEKPAGVLEHLENGKWVQ